MSTPLQCQKPTLTGAVAVAVAAERQRGVALVMALIFSILLYILVAELVVSSRMVRATGENDALLARMRTQMYFQLIEAEDKLLADLAGAAAGGGDPTANCDSSRDAWFEPVGHPDNDLTTYVWIEDENRKFNLLTIWSPDEDFANDMQEGLTRLIDTMREDTEFDVPGSDAALIVQEILEWGRRPDTTQMPTPRLKSDDEERPDLHIPLHLDELMMLRSIDEDLFFDKVIDERWYPGLESLLTIWTSLVKDPGDPEKVARQRAIAEARGERVEEEPAAGEPAAGAAAANGEEQGPRQPEGLGIHVNVNTATWPVLRALWDPSRVPDRIIDAIIRYRNEIDEEATEAAAEEGAVESSDFGDMRLGEQPLRRFFETLDDLENVEEFAQIPDEEVKAEIKRGLTTNSEVFSIHLATLFKRNDSERHRVYLLRRARSIVLRLDEGDEGKIVPLIPFEERVGVRVQPVEMQNDRDFDLRERYLEMDQFAQEERAWNPFLIDFYLPAYVREEFFSYR
ncbi:MAG TPA: hypothetical protein ENI87_08305 [bacterium]|nr:hypothetical protein [bacterium]